MTETENKNFNDFEGEESLSKEARENQENVEESNDKEIYPYKNINIGKDNLSAFQLYRKYKNNIIKLDPEFQREGNVWTPKQKSELIESIIIGIPLPILYVKEDKKGNWILIDGRQRLSTIFDFMDNKFHLSNLTILKDFNQFYFENKDLKKGDDYLNPTDRGKIEDVNLTLHIIKEPTPEKLTYDLFDRVNRGGTRLNNQEMRNAIYQGSSTELLKVLSKLENFRKATSNISHSRMKDRYLILRFISFYLWRKSISTDVDSKELNRVEYKSDLEDFLAKSMRFLNSKDFKISKDIVLKENETLYINAKKNIVITNNNVNVLLESDNFLLELIIAFDNAMQNIFELFKNNSFRLPNKKEDGVIRPINMALFEVLTYFFIEIENDFLIKKDYILKVYLNLISNSESEKSKQEDNEFIKSLTYIVDSNKSVNKRFEIIENCIKLIKDHVTVY